MHFIILCTVWRVQIAREAQRRNQYVISYDTQGAGERATWQIRGRCKFARRTCSETGMGKYVKTHANMPDTQHGLQWQRKAANPHEEYKMPHGKEYKHYIFTELPGELTQNQCSLTINIHFEWGLMLRSGLLEQTKFVAWGFACAGKLDCPTNTHAHNPSALRSKLGREEDNLKHKSDDMWKWCGRKWRVSPGDRQRGLAQLLVSVHQIFSQR